MNYYRLKAALLAPLVIQRSRQNKAPQALPYLPGSTFRGAVAAKYLREGGSPEDEKFRNIFIENPVCFPNLLPADYYGENISQVLPLTSVSCKRYPGFKFENGHGVLDALAHKVVERSDSGKNQVELCVKCNNDMKPIGGFWNGKTNKPGILQPTMFFQRHTGIDRATGTISHQIFFITQAIADFKKAQDGDYKRQILSGGMLLNDKQLELIKPLLKNQLFAGQDRTRGMGELEIEIELYDMILPEIGAWDKEFKNAINRAAGGNFKPEFGSSCYFSIKLESHAIFMDEFLRPTTELRLDFPEVDPVLKIVKPQTIKGWNDAWGLAKPDDMGVMMGSVYLFQYTGDDHNGLQQYLNNLTVRGVGLRRAEGFGQIRACDPLHIQEEVI